MISFVDNMIMGQTTCSTSATYQDHTQGDQKPYHRLMPCRDKKCFTPEGQTLVDTTIIFKYFKGCYIGRWIFLFEADQGQLIV